MVARDTGGIGERIMARGWGGCDGEAESLRRRRAGSVHNGPVGEAGGGSGRSSVGRIYGRR